jgi:hypothetical protein
LVPKKSTPNQCEPESGSGGPALPRRIIFEDRIGPGLFAGDFADKSRKTAIYAHAPSQA